MGASGIHEEWSSREKIITSASTFVLGKKTGYLSGTNRLTPPAQNNYTPFD